MVEAGLRGPRSVIADPAAAALPVDGLLDKALCRPAPAASIAARLRTRVRRSHGTTTGFVVADGVAI